MPTDDREKMTSNNAVTFAVVIAVIVILGVLVFLDIGMQKAEKEKPFIPSKTESLPIPAGSAPAY
jgi:hypothetical protein